MSAVTSISWTDRTWNPVRGCSVISPGCHNCYAMKQAHRFSGPGKAYEGLTKQTKAGPQWTGVVRTVESALLEPLSWRKPQRVFVNSMSDLFHEDVPDAFIDQVFAVMALAPRHTFQILTKRPGRMRDYIRNHTAADGISTGVIAAIARSNGLRRVPEKQPEWVMAGRLMPWPLENVWLGASVEDQRRADERKRPMQQLADAGWLTWVSYEPALERVDFWDWLPREVETSQTTSAYVRGIKWLVVGGESGPQAAGTPVFVKQLGSVPMMTHAQWEGTGDRVLMLNARNARRVPDGYEPIKLGDPKGGSLDEWEPDLQVRQFPETRP